MDVHVMLKDKESQFNALVEKKNMLAKEINEIDQELLRIQGEYRVLSQLVEAEAEAEAVEPEK